MRQEQTSGTVEFSVIFSALLHFSIGYNLVRGKDKSTNLKQGGLDVMRLLDLDLKVIPYIEKLILIMCAMRQVTSRNGTFESTEDVLSMFGLLYKKNILTATECISLYRPVFEDMNPDKEYDKVAIETIIDSLLVNNDKPSEDFQAVSNWIEEVNATHKSVFGLLPYLVHISETINKTTLLLGEEGTSPEEDQINTNIVLEYVRFLKFATELENLKKMHAGQLKDKIAELKTRVGIAS